MNKITMKFDDESINVKIEGEVRINDLLMCGSVLIDRFAKEKGFSRKKALKAVKEIFKNFNIDSKPGMFGEEE